MSPFAETSYETRFVEAVQLGAQQAISKYALHGLHDVDIEPVADMMGNSLILTLRAHVYEDPNSRAEKKHVIREQVTHPTWKHALIASLPKTALFRRRLLGYYFDIDPMWGGRRVTHTVTATRRGVFPEMTQRFPETFGRIQYITHFGPGGRYEEEL